MSQCTWLKGYENVKVTGARVIIKPTPVEETLASGLIIAKDIQEPKFEGTIVVAGPGSRLETGIQMPMEVGVGDTIIYSRMAGVPIEVEIDGVTEKLLVMNERDVIAILTQPKLYRHYKGDIYRHLMDEVGDADADNEWILNTMYQSVDSGKVWKRNTEDFYGNVEYMGNTVRRFTLIEE